MSERTALLCTAMRALALIAAVSVPGTAMPAEPDAVRFMSPDSASCAAYPQHIMQAFAISGGLGLDVSLLQTQTNIPYLSVLSRGEAEAALLDASEVLTMANAGLPGAAIYEAYQHSPRAILVPANSPIAGLSDLAGATIGMASERDQITTAIVLDAAGIAAGDVTTVVLGDSGPVMAHALTAQTIDALAAGAAQRARIEAEGIAVRAITPAALAQGAPVSITAWQPRFDELGDTLARFLRTWAMSQHAGLIDARAVMSACRLALGDEWRDMVAGTALLDRAIFVHQLRRTRRYGEIQLDVWERIQTPHLKLGEIGAVMHPATFTDDRWIDAANDWTTRQVRDRIAAWRLENADRLIP